MDMTSTGLTLMRLTLIRLTLIRFLQFNWIIFALIDRSLKDLLCLEYDLFHWGGKLGCALGGQRMGLFFVVEKGAPYPHPYHKDRLNILVFLSPSLCTKRSILSGQGNSTNTVIKRTPNKTWHHLSWNNKRSVVTQNTKCSDLSLIYNTRKKVFKLGKIEVVQAIGVAMYSAWI